MESERLFANRWIAWLVAIALALGCAAGLSACGDAGSSSASSAEGGSAAQASDGTRTVTVQGTDYTIPAQVDKVAPTIGALCQLTEMVGQGDSKVAATATQQVSDQFKAVIPSYGQSNPNGYDSSDIEQMIEAGVQVAYGPDSMYSDEQKAQLEEAGIVFIPMNNLRDVAGICQTTELIGQILGDAEYETAKRFTAYWQANIADCEERTAGIADADKPVVLNLSFSNGALTTESGETMIGSYIEAAGGVNPAADYSIQSQGGPGGGATVDEEQIVSWDPDYIIAYSTEATEQILANPALADVTAVREGHVHTSPKGLYLWAVRSGEGALMAPWIGTVINPDEFSDVDMVQMTQDFFKDYYDYDLSAEDAEKVLAGTF